jgi:sulfide:quinone oxidoreductase
MTALVLGAGVGGLVAARTLRRLLPRADRVVVVDREPTFSFAASYLWVMDGTRRPEQITRSREGLEARGIEVILGEVERIDPERREVVVGGRSLAADHLVVALGAEPAVETIPGLFEAGDTFATLEGAVRLGQALPKLQQGRVVVLTAAPAYRCPAAPYEAALLIDARYRRLGIRDKVSVDLYTAEPAPMGVAGPDVSAAVAGMVRSRGIGYHPATQVAAVDRAVARFAGGETAPFDLLVFMPPYRAPRAVRESALAGEGGWVSADRHTLETRFPGVYAIGDVTSIPLTLGKPLPKAGVFAHEQGKVVAERIADAAGGRAATARFVGHGACFVEAGNGRAGYGAGDFYAEPRPSVRLRRPGRLWHWAKAAFEWSFLRSWA